MELDTILQGDALAVLRTLPGNSIDCCVTSPPYWGLRDYGCPRQIGLEESPREYVARLLAVFKEVKRVLKPEGTVWLNLGDSYAGSGKGRNSDGTVSDHISDKQRSNRGSHFDLMPNNSCSDGLKAKDLVGIPWRAAFA